MRISDWSSDVCSSDLQREVGRDHERSLARNGKFVGTRTVEEAAAAAAGGQHRNQASGEDQFTHQFSDSVFAPFSRSRSARASRISTPKVMAASARLKLRKIGRASWRESVCPYESISVVAVSFNKKTKTNNK